MAARARDAAEGIVSSRLHLILMPTEACNFRCTYCYESFRLKRMTDEVVAGVQALLRRRAPGLRRLVLAWFGGEPLLASDIMVTVLEEVERLRKAHPLLAFESDATTNASLLTVPLLERLVSLGVDRYQVAFDGPRRVHDRKRVRPGGRPTFDQIWGNLLAARASSAPFRMQVRLHVDRENAGAIPEFLKEFRSSFDGDARYTLFIRGLSRFGGPNDATLPILEGEERRRTIDALRLRASHLGIPLAPMPSGPVVCYAAKGDSLLIRADGRVNKCTVALEHPANQVGRLLPDGSLRLRPERLRPWMRGFETGDVGTLSCPMRGLADPAAGSARTLAVAVRPPAGTAVTEAIP